MAHYLELDGEKVSAKEYCRRRGLKYDTIKKRVKNHNETFEQAIKYYEENGVKNHILHSIECDGELISPREYCTRNHLNYNTIVGRMYRHNETFEQAVDYYTKNGIRLQKKRGIVMDSRFYDIWHNMIDRCTNPEHQSFEKYSKLGIQESWLDFENFQDDMYEEYLKCPCSLNDLPSIDRKK